MSGLRIWAALFGILLLSGAGAETVTLIKGNVATRIQNLDVDGTLYDVTFRKGTFQEYNAAQIEPNFPGYIYHTGSFNYVDHIVGSFPWRVGQALADALSAAGADYASSDRGQTLSQEVAVAWGVTDPALGSQKLPVIRRGKFNSQTTWSNNDTRYCTVHCNTAFLYATLRPAGTLAPVVTYNYGGTSATSIAGLYVNGKFYNVTFENDTFNKLYANGKFPYLGDATATANVLAALDVLLDSTLAKSVSSSNVPYFVVPASLPPSDPGSLNFRNVSYGTGEWNVAAQDGLQQRSTALRYAVLTQAPAVLDVDLDPWTGDDLVRPDTNNLITVAVLGKDTADGDPFDFDVTQIDANTLRLGPGAAPKVSVNPLYGDYDHDGNTDAAFAFYTGSTGIRCDDTQVILQGETLAGDPFEGHAHIVTTDCMRAPAAITLTQRYGSLSAWLGYDFSNCYDEGSGNYGEASAELSSANPYCNFFGDSVAGGGADFTQPVVTSTSISTWGRVVTRHDLDAPYFVLGSISSGSVAKFNLDDNTGVAIDVDVDGQGYSLVDLTGGTATDLSFDPGRSTLMLAPGDYVLDTRLEDGPGNYLNRTTELSVRFSLLPRTVEIDVDPWSPANTVRPDSNDTIFVAILGSDPVTGDARNFDVNQIDPATLKFGVGQAPNIAQSPLYGDYDSDTNNDVAFAFRTQDAGIFCDDTEVTLEGETFAGLPFSGTGSIVTEDCETSSCHP